MPVYEYHPENLKKLRLQKDLTLAKFGGPLGFSRQLVWKWEQGSCPSVDQISAICQHYDVPMELFFNPTYYSSCNDQAM